MTLEEYLNLVTSAFRQKPVFIDTLSANLEALVQVEDLMTSMVPKFDLETAIGDQLDVVGEWVGISREVQVPISGVYFSWDGTDFSVGWDYGTWQPATAPTEVTILPDDVYRTVIKAKIAANHWNGTTTGAYAIWAALFTEFQILIQDNQNMTYALALVGGIVNSLTLALILDGYISLKPEGVRLAAVYTSVDVPVFAWDADSGALLAGWDEGSWVSEYTPS